jgi:hypothetical protein
MSVIQIGALKKYRHKSAAVESLSKEMLGNDIEN